jgi:hypothetical protein
MFNLLSAATFAFVTGLLFQVLHQSCVTRVLVLPATFELFLCVQLGGSQTFAGPCEAPRWQKQTPIRPYLFQV